MTTLRQPFAGQGHDIYLRRPRAEDAFAGDTMLSSKDEGAGDPPDLPVGQKMISAISGSLLTALLGEPTPPLLDRQIDRPYLFYTGILTRDRARP